MPTPVPETLKTPALNMFMHAKRFHLSQDILRREQNPSVFNITGIPALVLSAFASELYLKCLNLLESGAHEHTHDILRLFNRLKPETRKSISDKWDARIPETEWLIAASEKELGITIPRDLESTLASGARAFEELRYPKQGRKSHFGYADLPYMLEQVIYEAKPEWRMIRHTPPKDQAR